MSILNTALSFGVRGPWVTRVWKAEGPRGAPTVTSSWTGRGGGLCHARPRLCHFLRGRGWADASWSGQREGGPRGHPGGWAGPPVTHGQQRGVTSSRDGSFRSLSREEGSQRTRATPDVPVGPSPQPCTLPTEAASVSRDAPYPRWEGEGGPGRRAPMVSDPSLPSCEAAHTCPGLLAPRFPSCHPFAPPLPAGTPFTGAVRNTGENPKHRTPLDT